MRNVIAAAGLVLAAQCGFAELPGFYKSVDRVTWVVKDIKPVIAAWQKLEMPVDDYGVVEHEAEFRGVPVHIAAHTATARIGNLHVTWIQPLGGSNAYTDFLERHGDGVLSIMHRVPSLEALDQEAARMKNLGAGVLQRGTMDEEDGGLTYALFDTEPQGKYALGLVFVPPDTTEEVPAAQPPALDQFGLVARDLASVSSYWHKLGFPEMSFSHPAFSSLVFRGKAGAFDLNLGWQRHATVAYEWIQPVKGPSVYDEYLQAHGEGLHHLGFYFRDMRQATARWSAAGFSAVQSGNWGEPGKPGSGRFTYVDMDAAGGVAIELLWSPGR